MAEKPKNTFTSTLMRGDRVLWGIYLALIVISIVEMFSASSRLTYKATSYSDPTFRHVLHLLLGFLLITFFQGTSAKAMRRWAWLIYGSGFTLLMLLPVMGRKVQGAYRDILGVQPVEIVKVGTMMVLCLLITASLRSFAPVRWMRHNFTRNHYLLLLVAFGVPALLVAVQNLSSAMIICISAMCVMFLGGIKHRYLGITLASAAAAGALAMAALFALENINESRIDAGKKRLELGFLDRANVWAHRIYGKSDRPLWEEDPNGDSAQTLYAHMALANSYPLGRFVGNSQARDFLPEAYSDYIFAIIFEELGVVGAVVVLAIYIILLLRSFYLARMSDDPFVRLLMVALPLCITIQALIHIGVCTGAMFVTGQPLPLVSNGGSSIVMTSVAFGIMFALSRQIANEQLKADSK